MNSLIIASLAALLYIIAYHTYGKFLARRIFQVDPNAKCPSETHHDGIDFVATDKLVLFGHHFTSIAGTGPIVGPAIAVIWGWLPALIWVVVGSILMGAVHDFGAMMISLRHQGRSIGDIAGTVINDRVKFLFMLIIFFALWIVVAIFGVVIAAVFSIFPQSVIPVWLQLPIAIWLGFMVYKRGKSHVKYGLIATGLMYLTIVLGSSLPVSLPSIAGLSPVGSWVILLLIYAYVASTLPVTVLLQPRDYINAFQLCIAMGLLFLGIIVVHPPMVVGPIHHAEGSPPLIPLLFITVACGAISGFHCLVSSGTSSKQCDKESSAQPIGFGGMLLEGMLAVIVIICCGAGLGLGLEKNGTMFTGLDAFQQQYASWATAKGLGAKIAAFVTGAGNIVAGLGLPRDVVITLMGVFVASFAATTLDTATRLQRYIVSELATSCKLPALSKKHPATAIAVITAMVLAFSSGADGKGALALWPLFGSVNQLLGGLALLVMTVWLARKNLPIVFTGIPMVFMIAVTAWAMQINLCSFYADGQWLLFSIGMIIVLLQTWMIIEGLVVLNSLRRTRSQADG